MPKLNHLQGIAIILISVFLLSVNAFGDQPIYKNINADIEDRIDDLLIKMSLDEKLLLVGGNRATHVDTLAIERLGIPAFHTADGPHGVRGYGPATSFPTGITMAATWNPELIRQMGAALGNETLAKKRNIILGPCVNLHRVPHGGRNFESFSEDPYLAARLAVEYIKGVQSTKAAASVKHYACNNQEWNRKTIDTIVSERALHEIYFPPFKAAVQEADVWTVMACYNKVNGIYGCESRYLLTDILKSDWGFKGLVISDWGAVHSTIQTANAGLELEMPYRKYLGEPLMDEVKEGNVPMSIIDDKIRRILRVMMWGGIFDGTNTVDPNLANCKEHQQLAKKIADEGIVLLKNNIGYLPLNADSIKSIAVIGPNADKGMIGGSGSSEVTPPYAVSALEAIKEKYGDKIEIHYARGCYLDSFDDFKPIDPNVIFTPDGKPGLLGEYFANTKLEGEPVHTRIDTNIDFWWGYNQPAPSVPIRNFSVRWTGKIIPKESGTYRLAAISEPGSRLFINGGLVIDNWADHQVVTKTTQMYMEKGQEYHVRLEFYEKEYYAIVRLGWMKYDTDLVAEAQLASKCDVALVFGGVDKPFEGEGHDRPELELPGFQDRLINAVAAANQNTVVILQNGTPVLMPWVDKVPAIVEALYPGQEGGNSIIDILFGQVNPSGKLPTTFPKKWEDSNAYGSFRDDFDFVVFDDDIFIGYRHFDTYGIEPLFPFGHGLSYTTFKYSDLNLEPVSTKTVYPQLNVTLKVTNTGQRYGAEVVQLYVRDIVSDLPRPLQELKGFKKVYLKPGESQKITFTLDKDAFSYYNPEVSKWVVEPGLFEIRLGSSSRDIRLKGEYKIGKASAFFEKILQHFKK